MSGIESQLNINSPKANDNNSLSKTALGIATGAASGLALAQGLDLISKPYYKLFFENSDKFTSEDGKIIAKEADRMVDESSIRQKGFNGITYINPDIPRLTHKEFTKRDVKNHVSARDNLGRISFDDAELERLKSGRELYSKKGGFVKLLSYTFNIIRAFTETISSILTGNIHLFRDKSFQKKFAEVDSVFDPISNKIYTVKSSMLLHEIGHAINKNASLLTRLPKTLKLVSGFLIPLTILNALFTQKPSKSESDGQEHKSAFKKLRDFTHRHIGLTVAGLFIPTLVEEGLASVRAIKFANASKVMSEAMKNQHNKNLKMAYGTYLFTALVAGLTAKLAVFVKDKVSSV